MKKLIYAEATNELEFEGFDTFVLGLDGSLVNCIKPMQQKRVEEITMKTFSIILTILGYYAFVYVG